MTLLVIKEDYSAYVVGSIICDWAFHVARCVSTQPPTRGKYRQILGWDSNAVQLQ